MERLEAAFAAARPAKRAELNGNWVLVTEAYTQEFIDGQNGPDYVLRNENGLRNADVDRQSKRPSSGNPQHSDNPQQFYWKLTFRHLGKQVQVVSQARWSPWGDVEPIKFYANGDFEFEPDFGAEGDFKYRCRMESPTQIVCLHHKGGDGMEFRKVAD